MRDKIKALYEKHGDILRYLIIGGITTAIDLLLFALLHTVLGVHYQVSKVITWVAAVVFAYWGNKQIVFRSKTEGTAALAQETTRFFVMRLITLGITLLFMYVAVDLLAIDANLSNLMSMVLVIILNYILSKLFVFKQSKAE